MGLDEVQLQSYRKEWNRIIWKVSKRSKKIPENFWKVQKSRNLEKSEKKPKNYFGMIQKSPQKQSTELGLF